MDSLGNNTLIRINAKAACGISLLSITNEPLPGLLSLAIENISEVGIKNLRVEISFEPSIAEKNTIYFNYIGPKSRSLVSPNELKKIVFKHSYFSVVHDLTEGKIIIRAFLEDKEEPISSETLNIKLLPFDTWGSTGELKYSHLASFVSPSSLGVKRIASLVNESVQKDNRNAIVGYSSDEEGVEKQIEILYNILQNQHILYFNPPASFEYNGQRIRLPEIVLREKQATCIDLSILFASVLECMSLHPVLAIKEGHAFVGCFLDEDYYLSNSVEDSHSHVYSLVQQGKLLMLEATALTDPSVSFAKAIEAGRISTLEADDFFVAIDISICRESGILPLPIRIDEKTNALELDESINDSFIPAHKNIDKTILEPLEKTNSGFDLWERELLDLSMNNPLLNVKIKRRMVSLLCTDSQSFADLFKDDTHFSLIFKPASLPADPDPLFISENSKYSANFDSSLKTKKLVCLDTESVLSDKIKNIYRRSRDSLNETGSNILFVALGLLKYSSDEDVLTSYHYAPIILIPVDLVKENKGKNYYIRPRDEDWLVNTTLIEFLKKEKAIDISGIEKLDADEDGHLNIHQIINTVSDAIGNINGWLCYGNYLGLGTFDFSHYCMWNDIRLRKSQLEKNPIVKSLATGRKEWSDSDSINPIKESDCCIPLVADSSQIEAIKKCADGKSFILFGPPGTGKSQTIVNMIANSLYHGKKVLFVSEKQAALDVVYNRLKKIKLSPFCLQLHSAKASKSSVLTQFSESLKNAQIGSPVQFQKTKEEIDSLREKLVYDIECFNKKGPFFISINDALIGYESVKEYRLLPDFDEQFLRNLNEETFKKILDVADKMYYLESHGQFGTYYHNDLMPLRGHAYGLKKREDTSKALDALYIKANYLAASINRIKEKLRPAFTLTRENVSCLVNYLKAYLTNESNLHPLAKALVDMSLKDQHDKIVDSLSDLKSYQDSKDEIKEFIDLEMLDHYNFDSTIKKLDKYGTSFFDKYRKNGIALKELKPFLKTKIKKKDAYNLFIKTYNCHNDRNVAYSSSVLLKSIYHEDFKDIDSSPYSLLLNLYEYSCALESSVAAIIDDKKRHKLFVQLLDMSRLIDIQNVKVIQTFLKNYDEFIALKSDFAKTLDLDLDYLYDRTDFYTSLPNLIQKIKEKLTFANDWASINTSIDELKALSLDVVVEALDKDQIKLSELKNAILCDIYLNVALLAIKDNNLESFSGLNEEAIIAKYNEETKIFRELSIAQLRAMLSANIPTETNNASSTSELGFLKKAIASNGHGKSIRKIIDGALNLIRTLCPCFLMSPMSAATYLSVDIAPFDIVIFDEASQIPTAEAIGPISRGKSLIVCGDTNQLPPTSFFKKDNTENMDFTQTSLPSILEECKTIMLPEQELRWHYRSRSESLIAFSNHEFYYDSLYTFPSVDDQKSAVSYIYVDSSYDRSRSKTNLEEAKAIVAEVIKRKRSNATKKQSIGIVAFSQAQKDLIEDLLDDAFSNNEAAKLYDDSLDEPIFVKNLENVQGDERDVIIFSIGYGLDANKRMTMNFGPINGINGFRRLNVAISRARKEMLVYTNIDPDKYHDEDIDNPGAQYLFRFLRYAKHGRSELSSSTKTKEKDTQIVSEAIAEKLREKGYTVHTAIGDSAFNINVAIADNDNPERYVLGVMIEGEVNSDYHLVDKVEIQPQVLTSLGWKVIRVYVLDWINSPNSVLLQIEEAYSKAMEGKDKSVKKEKEKKSPIILDRNKKKRKSKGVDYLMPDYKKQKLPSFTKEKVFSAMSTVIASEGPIQDVLLLKRVMDIFSVTRKSMTKFNQFKECYDAAFEDASKFYKVTTNADGSLFFWPMGIIPEKYDRYRKNTGNYKRAINEIAEEEIAVAIYDVLANQFSIGKAALSKEILSCFQYSRANENNMKIIEAAIDYAIQFRQDFVKVGENGQLLLNPEV